MPSQVTGLSLSKAVLSRLPALRATWTTPQSDEPISQYILQYRINVTTFWRSQRTISGTPPRNSILLTSLAAGTEYNVRVRAESAVGTGDWSAVQTERTYKGEFFSMITIVFIINHSVNHAFSDNFCHELQLYIWITIILALCYAYKHLLQVCFAVIVICASTLILL